MIEPRAPRQADAEGGIFDEDDSDLAENQEFDRALAMGTEALSRGDADGARQVLEKALRYKPRNQRARNLLGLSLFKLGELEKAEAIYRGLIEDHPADPTLRVNLGLVFLKSGASADAVRCFETTLDLAPDHQKAQNYLGLALAQKGELARAREWFLKSGNSAMAERMVQALAASPIREVAEGAAERMEEEQPFTNAASDAALAADRERAATAHRAGTPKASAETATETAAETPSEPPETEPAHSQELAAAKSQSSEHEMPVAPARSGAKAVLTPPLGSRWVATQPAALTAPPVAQALQPTPLGRMALPHVPSPEALPARSPKEAAQEATAPAALPSLQNEFEQPSALAAYTNTRRLSVPSSEGGFGIGASEVLVQVRGEMLTRLDGLVASWGSMTMKPELKRFRGKATDKPFGEGARRMLRAQGEGRYVISREGRYFTALELADEPAYFREEILFAFEESILFENGRVPSKIGQDLHLVHLRGRGKLLLVTSGPPRSVEVSKGEPLRIPMDQLVGWHGPLIQPRLVPIVEEAPELGVALELAGEGRALVDAPDGR